MWWLLVVVILLFGFVAFRGAPYVPSRRRDVETMLDELWQPSADDVLVDIGSGGGGVLRAVAARGARAVGYELNPLLVVMSWARSRVYGKRVRVLWADFWLKPLPDDVTAVYVFGDSRDIAKMAGRVEVEAARLGRPLLLISYAFKVPARSALRQNKLFFVYQIEPLHRREA